jgi:hypothetical protein
LPCSAFFSHPPGERGAGAGAGALAVVCTVGVVVI